MTRWLPEMRKALDEREIGLGLTHDVAEPDLVGRHASFSPAGAPRTAVRNPARVGAFATFMRWARETA